MSVSDGQDADQVTFNTAFMSRDALNTDTVAKVDLLEVSTTDLIDLQRVVNEALDSLGIANQAATDASADVYSSNNVVTDGDDRKVAIGKLDGEFDTTTGHDHDGVNSKQVDAANLTNVNNLFAEFQEFTFDNATGTSDDVSSLFSGKSSGGDSVTEGVITSAPNNYVPILEKDNGGEIEDTAGRRVFARLTEAASVWTLTYYVNISGTETSTSLTTQDIRFLFREVFDQNDRPTIGANVAVYDTLSAVGDIPDATATQRGLVSTGAQTWAGVKDYISRPTVNGVDIVDTDATQVIIKKDIDASNVAASDINRIVVANETSANLAALTRKKGHIAFDNDLSTLVVDDGTQFNELGAGGAGGGLDVFYTEDFEDTDAADLTSGNNATFDNGGTLQGTLADETVSPIAGSESIEYTQAAGSLNDWWHTGNISIDEKEDGQIAKRVFYANYDGDTGDIQAIVWDDTNNQILGFVDIEAVSDSKRYEIPYAIPVGVTILKFGFQVKTENIGAILVYDDEEGTLNPFTSIPTKVDQLVQYHQGNGRGSTDTRIRRFTNLTRDIGAGIFTVANTAANGMTITAEQDCEIWVSFTDRNSSTPAFGLSLNSTQLTSDFDGITEADRLAGCRFTGVGGHTSWAGKISSGDVIRPHMAGVTEVNSNSETMITIYAQADNPSVAVATGPGNQIVEARTSNGYGSTNTKIRRFSSSTVTGTAISFADTAADGSSFTINEDGLYHISYSDSSAAAMQVGLSVNSTQLTTNVLGITAADRLAAETPAADVTGNCAVTVQLCRDDVVRPHTSGGAVSSNGTGQAIFYIAKIANRNLSAIPNLDVLAPEAILTEQFTSGTAGGTFTSGSYQTRALNTVKVDKDFVSLASNQFTLDAGKYSIEARAIANQVDDHKARIQNTTDASTAIVGDVSFAGSGQATTHAFVSGVITITESKTFELQHRCLTTKASNGFGDPATFGDDEIYSSIKIKKIG